MNPRKGFVIGKAWNGMNPRKGFVIGKGIQYIEFSGAE